jgi:hypothetical protein
MGVHPFQISDLNWNFFSGSPVSASMGSFASEFAIMPDNVNANLSRYMKLQAVWSNVAIGPVTSINDSFGQPTGSNNQLNNSNPFRPNGGYFVRGLYFTNTNVPTNDSTGAFRVGYIGSFVGGLLECDYVHDPNQLAVDYEPIYSHGAATWPMTASQAKQWRDPVNPPSDGTDLVTNSSSALSRNIYMPQSYMLLHIDSAGSNTLVSGNVKFHLENRPTLHMAGFVDNINNGGPNSPNWAGAGTPSNGEPYSYGSDPIRNYSNLAGNSATNNFHELFQVTGVRKLNSRGLSFHLAKYYDNGAYCYAYPFEEDGITLGTGIPPLQGGGNSIAFPYTYVNDQQEYTWAGGRDQGAANLTTSVSANVVTVTFNAIPTPFPTGAVVLMMGLTNHPELNGAMLTVLAGSTNTSFTANWTNGNYAAIADNGAVVYKPDFRIRNAATFIINEEYFGTVMDTKCAIWSNKSSMIPLLFFDLADTWTSSAAKRIAGVAVVPLYINATGAQSWQIFFISEDGKLARYDFNQTNGVLELAGSGSFSFATNAPAVAAAGEAYGSLRERHTTSTITNIAITTNVLTVSCTNTFEAGEIVNLQGLTTATFLNNQTVTVSTAGGSSFTAAYTHANYTSAPDTGTAVGYSLWVLYGTMSTDPRLTQTGLTNNANINLYRYLIGTGVWGSKIASPNTGRHNGRSLSEMIVARGANTNDGVIYILCEDVTTSAGFNVSNAYPNTASSATSTSVQITSNVVTIQAVNTFAAGQTVLLNSFSSANFLNGYQVTVLSTGLTGAQFEFNLPFSHADYGPFADGGTAIVQTHNINWQVQAYDPVAATWNTAKITGSLAAAPLQYGTNFGTPPGAGFQENHDFWFQNPNAFLHDIAPNKILIQPNWTAGANTTNTSLAATPLSVGFQVLDVSGTTAALTNTNLSTIQRGTIFPNDSFIPSQVEPAVTPCTVLHARDFASNGERTVFWLNDLARNNPDSMPLYLAPPSFNWGSPTGLSLIQRNSFGATNPKEVLSFQKDFWCYVNVGSFSGSFEARYAWVHPTQFTDNYLHWIVGTCGTDGLPGSSTYGRSFGQWMGFVPTYWKWTGSAWVMADNWTDASTNPYTVPNAGVNVPLPYGLQVQFGLTGASSYTFGEFQTFNLAWGNTKFARKLRQSYGTFAGQTFTNIDTRTVTTQNALSMHLVDTDLGTITNTAPTSATPQTASLNSNPLGWLTQTTWNKLDGANVGFDATPYTTVWNVNTSNFDTTTFALPAAGNVTGTTPGPYSWVANGLTYQAQASGENNPSVAPAWQAVSGNPQRLWSSNTANTGILYLDLNTAQTVRSYGFRPTFSTNDTLDNSCVKSWTLEGSTAGSLAAAISGSWTVVDTRGPFTSFNRGASYNVASPGSFRFYRFNISAAQNGGVAPSLSMLRLSTSVLVNTVNFNEMVFYAYGSNNGGPTYVYPFIRNWQMARGIKLEVSTNGGGSYTTVFSPGVTSPLWRALNGYVWTFPRQTGVTNVRITVNHGYNYASGPNSGNQPTTTAFGPFYFIDYNAPQATIDAARLGNSLSAVGTPTIASFDPNCLGMAVDVPNISIDSDNPSSRVAMNLLCDTAVHGFWSFDFVPDAVHSTGGVPNFKMHPFYGFIFFQGAGGSGGVSTQTGTNAVINYQWGRRV